MPETGRFNKVNFMFAAMNAVVVAVKWMMKAYILNV